MRLTREEVKAIARLARLELTDAELEKFSEQLSGILNHSKMLDEVDTSHVEPIAQITGLTTITFADTVKSFEDPAALLAQSPQPVEGHMIRVKNVFE